MTRIVKKLRKEQTKVVKQRKPYEVYDNESFLKVLLKSIDTSNNSIKIQCMTFEADGVGLKVIEHLKTAVERGVQVQLLVDTYTNININDKFVFLPKVGEETKKEHARTQKLFSDLNDYGINLRRTGESKHPFIRLPFTNHKKIMIFDNEHAYLGGINVSDHNFFWRDLMVKIQSEAVKVFNKDFDYTWRYLRTRDNSWTSDTGNETIISEKYSANTINSLAVHLIKSASQKIYLETPYFLNYSLTNEMCSKAKNGVDVKVIFPNNVNRPLPIIPKLLKQKLVKCGVKVFEHQKSAGMTHAKLIISDNISLFGSSNFNSLLSLKDDEIAMVVDNDNLAIELANFLEKGIADSKQVNGK